MLNKIVIYEYDKKNREYIISELEKKKYHFCIIPLKDEINIKISNMPQAITGVCIDITPYFRDDERSILYVDVVEKLIDVITENIPFFILIDKRYTYGLKDLLIHKIKKIVSLEKEFHLTIPESRDIVSLTDKDFVEIIDEINKELIGNQGFKKRLEQELKKYRVFNQLGYQPIFSVLICGNSGIGKTEVARILARALSSEEPFIKINFGNYSDQNALSSLIGSPRGYVGSSKGELSDKLANSNSKIILIDEFEKSNKQVQNFFLQLLEDGVFTDSLGRDYDLNRYIIVFTANLSKQKIPEKISPELLSRFNLKYSFSELSEEEKKLYIVKRTTKILNDIQNKLNVHLDEHTKSRIIDIDCKKYINMRDINAEIMKRISDVIYSEIY